MPANAVHWHLLLNHLPIMAVLFGIPVLLYGTWRMDDALARVALALFVFAGVAVIPVTYTGDSAEEIAEELQAVSEEDVKIHEEAAETAYYLTLGLAVYALGGLVYYRGRETTSWLYLIGGAALAAVILISLADAATKGGYIRHPEINMTAPAGIEDPTPDGTLPERSP